MSDLNARLEQNKIDQERLKEEQRKLEKQIEDEGFNPQHGDYGYYIGDKHDPIIYLKSGVSKSKMIAIDNNLVLSEPLSQWKTEIEGNIFRDGFPKI